MNNMILVLAGLSLIVSNVCFYVYKKTECRSAKIFGDISKVANIIMGIGIISYTALSIVNNALVAIMSSLATIIVFLFIFALGDSNSRRVIIYSAIVYIIIVLLLVLS